MNKYYIFEDSKLRSFGGGQQVSSTILSLLNVKSNELTLFDSTKSSNFQIYIDQNNYKSIKKDFYNLKDNYLKNPDSRKSSFTIPFLSMFKEAIFIILPEIVRLRRYKSAPDIIVATTKKTFIIALLFSIFNNKKIKIYFYHHCFYPKTIIGISFINLIGFLSNLDKKNTYTNIFVSRFTAKSFTRKLIITNNFSNKIVYNTTLKENILKGYREDNLNLNPHKEKIIISIFASLIPWKGMIEAIIAYSKLSNYKKQKYKLQVYGEGELLNKAKLLAKEIMGCEVYGFEFVENILINTNITIIPSIGEESCPISAIESLCAGKPTFSLPIGGQQEILKILNNEIDNPNNIYELLEMATSLGEEKIVKLSEAASNLYDSNFSLELYRQNIKSTII